MFSNIAEDRVLASAKCYLTDLAATWLIRLETRGKKARHVNDLQKLLIKEFVPPDDRARAKVSLIEIQMRSSKGKHFSKFNKLVEITDAPENEEYIFIFMSLPGKYKPKVSEKYPSGMLTGDKGMTAVYEDAQNWALSMR